MDGVSALLREVMPAHRVYCEPWFLGGEVFFRKRPSAVEFINDSDNRIMDFYMVVRSRPQELAFLIESTLYSDTLVRLADDIYHGRVVSDELYRAWAVWMRYQTSRQGAMSWMKDTGLCLAAGDIRPRSSLLLDGYLDKRLSQVVLLNRDAVSVINEADGKDTFFYFQPTDRKELAALGSVILRLKGKFALYYHEKGILDQFAHSLDLAAEENERGDKIYVNFRRMRGLFDIV